MKKIITISVVCLVSVFGFGLYSNYQSKQREKYWLSRANIAAVNSNKCFIEFYNKYNGLFGSISIEDGWDMYERFSKNYNPNL